MQKRSWGLVGMGVMGTALSRNFARQGFSLSLYNRYVKGQEEQLSERQIARYEDLKEALPFEDVSAFVASLERPRKILMMISAGPAIDEFISQIMPYLEPDDILIDGGNAHYENAIRRANILAKSNIHFFSLGVSGGEAGALKGPSLMASGKEAVFDLIEPALRKVAAQNSKNQSCFVFTQGDGSGHFIKMVHNGIEYAEMQLLAECYDLMKTHWHLSNTAISTIFDQWQQTTSKSYLLEITISILQAKNESGFVIDQILDSSSNKGTGKWALISASNLGVAVPMMGAALQARFISSSKEERTEYSKQYVQQTEVDISETEGIAALKRIYDFSRLINHHQGFALIQAAVKAYHWEVDMAKVAQAWTAGCIIQSELMGNIATAFKKEGQILSIPKYSEWLRSNKSQLALDYTLLFSENTPMPCSTAAWHYFLGISQKDSAANLIQAQRDYFGAHGFQWKNDPDAGLSHGPWNSSLE